MNTILLVGLCLIGLGFFCICLLVMICIWSYWCYKYPVIRDDEEFDEEYDFYE